MQSGNLMFSKTHEWIKIDGDIVTIGITDFAIQQLSDLVYIDLPKVERLVKTGEPFGEIESVKTVSDLDAPVSGKIIETNENLSSNLDIITKDPYGAGWLIKIKMSDLSELKNLLSAEDYNKLCEIEK